MVQRDTGHGCPEFSKLSGEDEFGLECGHSPMMTEDMPCVSRNLQQSSTVCLHDLQGRVGCFS